jgi:MYXO-CTERM domain-containing protein
MRLPLILLVLTIPVAREAHACGGLFCNALVPFPIAQSGEGIVFAVDSSERVVTAVISIQYQGEASEFAWVLPLESAPLAIDVAPSAMFARIDGLTAARFGTRFETEGICVERDFSLFGSEEVLASQAAPSVQVVRQEEVGPYDSVVIASSNAGDLRAWLEENGYSVTDAMMESVTPYVAKGDVLLALRLRKDNDVGDIQPVVVTMQSEEVCVPIRLTAIAALDDMDITVHVLSNEGRAIPENYNHVTLNLARIDWLDFGSNYRSLVAEAVDEGSGHAFTTEFAGDASIFRNQISRSYDEWFLREQTTVAGFLQALLASNLLIHREVIAILVRHIPDAAFTAAGTTKEEFADDPRSATLPFPNDPFEPKEAVDEIWDRVVTKEIAMQALFDRFRYATRLYTLISPDEMTLDPTFTFDGSLPNVENIHTAEVRMDCGIGGARGGQRGLDARIVLDETGDEIAIGDIRDFDRADLRGMPAARRIEQLAEKRLIQDNSEAIADFLDEHNRKVDCGCSATAADPGGALLAVGLVLLALWRRR